jgi:hypothetical protein
VTEPCSSITGAGGLPDVPLSEILRVRFPMMFARALCLDVDVDGYAAGFFDALLVGTDPPLDTGRGLLPFELEWLAARRTARQLTGSLFDGIRGRA